MDVLSPDTSDVRNDRFSRNLPGESMMDRKSENPFQFLKSRAVAEGAVATCLIPAEGIIVENRGRFKCSSGCPYYGTSLVCPPHSPRPDEFRDVIKEYTQALLVRFQTVATAGDEISSSLLMMGSDPAIPSCQKEELQAFFSGFGNDCKKFHHAMLNLEKSAFLAGYPFAVALMPGPCILCDTCNGLTGSCIHPTKRRFPADALGVNLLKTANLAGMEITFPFHKSPSSFGILLIE